MSRTPTNMIMGDCLEVLKSLKAESVDSLVTDPPAGISFMGKDWDGDKGGRKEWVAWMTEVMSECIRVMKPGAHGLVWALPRTSHWTACALEEAGFEIRDCIYQIFGTGFPKSLNVNKALEKDGRLCTCSRETGNEESSRLLPMQKAVHSKDERTNSKAQDVQLPVQRCNETLASGVCCSPKGDCIKHEGEEACTAIRCVQPSVEGRCDVQEEQGQLHRPEICAVPAGTNGDGSQRRLRDGAQACDSSTSSKSIEQDRGSSSQRSRHQEQLPSKPRALAKQQNAQAGRAWEACGVCGKYLLPEGLGTALKPAVECWWLVRKPLSEKTVAANVIRWGTGALNIDASRIAGKKPDTTRGTGGKNGCYSLPAQGRVLDDGLGRFPSHLILDEESAAMLDEQSGDCKTGSFQRKARTETTIGPSGYKTGPRTEAPLHKASSGGASRFFYCAKVSPSERGDSTHPTMKSQKLMRYLIKLVTPSQGVVLDPFMGSGSTGLAAQSEGFGFIGIEREQEYFEIGKKRLERKKNDLQISG